MLPSLLLLLGPVILLAPEVRRSSSPSALASDSSPACPADMRHVSGTHYDRAQRLCVRLVRDICFEFNPDVVAFEGSETTVDVCVDQYEWPNKKGEKPPVMMRFTEAADKCKSVGKRLCSEVEWELACEGPATLPFPDGYAQVPGACINDKPYKPYDGAKLESSREEIREREIKRLYQGEPSGSRPRCTTPFGVVDMVGNVEEWVTTSRPEWPHISSLKGGYWSKPWSKCRGTNDSHGPRFRFYEIGFRCCVAPVAAGPP